MRDNAIALAVLLVGCAAIHVFAAPTLRHPVHTTAKRMLTECDYSGQAQCQENYESCVAGFRGQVDQTELCQCYSKLGLCVYRAGCLNGTYENLHTAYCRTGDSYCCSQRGEFVGCGEQEYSEDPTDMCMCEEGYTGSHCNGTVDVCRATDDCPVCSACCKPYSADTCESCVQDECRGSCNPSTCNVCNACCKSYLADNQVDCNVCVQHECPHMLDELTWA